VSLLDRILGPKRRPRVVLVTRSECPLCDEAKDALAHAQSVVPFDLEVKSIDADEALRKEHALEVPVVFVDGKKRFFGRVAPLLLHRELRAAARRE
jgi:glutaredoxin